MAHRLLRPLRSLSVRLSASARYPASLQPSPFIKSPPNSAPLSSSFVTQQPTASATTSAPTAASPAPPVDANHHQPPTTLAQYLDLLRTDVQKLRRVHGATLQSALDQARFSTAGRQVSSADALFLLQCCSLLPERPRPEKLALIELAWSLVLRSLDDRPPTGDQLIALLREYRTNQKKLDFDAFLDQYQSAISADPQAPVLESLLYLAAEIADERAMVRMLQCIRDRNAGRTPHEDVFNALILGHSRAHRLDKCTQVLDKMREAGVRPSGRTHKELIRAHIENGQPDRAVQLFLEHADRLSVAQLMSVIRTAIRRDDQSRVLRLAFDRLPDDITRNRHIVPDIRNACVELIQANEARKAFRIIEHLPVPAFSDHDDADGYASFFLSELIRSGSPADDVVEVARKLIDSGRNARALHVCCEVSLRHGCPDALRYLQELARVEPLRPAYFWPLLVREHQQAGEAGLLQVLRDMHTLDVQADGETLALFVLPRLPLTLAEPLLAGVKELLDERAVRMSVLLGPLLTWLAPQSRLREAAAVVQAYPSRPDGQPALLGPLLNYARNARNQDAARMAELAQLLAAIGDRRTPAKDAEGETRTDLSGQLLVELVTSPNKRMPLDVLVRWLQQFRAHGVRVSTLACDIVEQYVQKCSDGRLRTDGLAALGALGDRRLNGGLDRSDEQQHIRHPRDMSLDELECHLVELRQKGGNVRGVLRRLLQQTVRAGRLDRALELHGECQRERVSLSAGMLSATMELMVRTGDLRAAEAALRQLDELFPAFSVDEHKLLDVAGLQVKHQKLQTAMELLKRRAGRPEGVRGGQGVQKNVWQLLTNVALLSDDAAMPLQAGTWFEALRAWGYCEPSNALLGPLVRECLHKGLLRRAVEEYADAAKLHRCTPLQFELMRLLIGVTNESDGDAERRENRGVDRVRADEAKRLLQQIIETSIGAHGAVNTNVSLVVAFAHAGSDAQLRKILIDPAVRVSMPAILKQCGHMCESGAVEPLMRLARCSRGMSGEVSEADFYGLLMAQHVRTNDVEAAMGLFERLVADDEFKVGAELARRLIGLLERNNMEVPSMVQMFRR